MLWKPSTYGEELFLSLYKDLGSRISVRGPRGIDLNFLVSPFRFEEFARLTATLEVFLRCVRSAKRFYEETPDISPKQLGSKLRTDEGIPDVICANREFCEFAKQTGRIAAKASRLDGVENNALRDEPSQCYVCDVNLSNKNGARDKYTVEHIWPLSLGGETIEDNLLPACKDCNEKRSNAITWAWGPVQSTYHTHTAGKSPPSGLRLSLAIAKLMLAAKGEKILTLKEAAKRIRPIVPILKMEEHHPHLYFELFQQCEGPI